MQLGNREYDFGEMSFMRVLGIMGVLLALVAILLLLTPDMQPGTMSWRGTTDESPAAILCVGAPAPAAIQTDPITTIAPLYASQPL